MGGSTKLNILNGTLAMLAVSGLIALVALVKTPLPAVPPPVFGPEGRGPAGGGQTGGGRADSASLIAVMGSRPFFHVEDRLGSASPQRPAATSQANAMAQRLRVIGVVTTVPAQAILEDAQTHKTTVVTVGQSVMDGATVEAIHDHRVMLDVQGELVELSW